MRDFGDYECLARVASGSTGTVWRARHRELDRVVAVKELSAELRGRPGFLDIFRAEAQHLATIDSPHVIRLYDYVEEPDRAWMAEEWVDGIRLDRLLQEHGRLTAEQALGVMRGVLQGLAAAHAIHLVHGDVAPTNVLVGADGTAKLVDFGLAAPVDTPGHPDLLGTPAYLSPEAVLHAGCDPRSDVYSAAAVLVELLTGNPPYSGGSVQSVLQRQVEAPPPALDEVAGPLRGLLRRALAKDPGQRPVDAAAFLSELEESARLEYGTGWLERSSLAGVAAGLVTAGAGSAAGGLVAGALSGAVAEAGAGASTSAASAFTATAASTGTAGASGGASVSGSTITSEAAARSVRFGGRKLLYLAGGGATTAAAVTVALVVLTGSPPLEVAGSYRFSGSVISSEFPDIKPGTDVGTATWTVPDCGKTPCSGTIVSSSGKRFAFTLDGSDLTVRASTPRTEQCLSHGLAQERADTEARLRTDQEQGAVRTFSGVQNETVTATAVPAGCVIGPPKHTAYSITLTRVG